MAAGVGLFGVSLLGLLGFVLFAAACVPGFGLGMVFLLPTPLLIARKAAELARRRTLRWAGLHVPSPYTPEPPPPVRQSDGWYVHDRQLYRKAWLPTLLNRLAWLLGDNATWRDLGWMLVAPVTGGFVAVLPVAVVVAAISWSLWLFFPAVLAGLLIAPVTLKAAAHFNRRLLGGPFFRTASEHPVREWFGRAIVPVLKLAVFFLTSVLGVLVFAATALGVILGYGLGLFFLVPWALEDLRWLADWRRRIAPWSGVSIPQPYRPLPPLAARPDDGLYRVGKYLYKTKRWASWAQRTDWLIHDPATWREVLWRGIDPIVGGLIAGVPVFLVGYGIWGLALPRVTQTLFGAGNGSDWYGHLAGHAWPALPAGLLMAALGIAIAPPALKLHGRWSRQLLSPTTTSSLSERIEELTVSRAEASSAAAAELRRIERDLHDGAQARLVALGLSLAAIERLMDTEPTAAKELLAKSRESAAVALRELREVVRGVHPPVLAERGLVDAVRALALDSPVTAKVTAHVSRRLADPLEAAAYFAVAEALGNAARHSGASKVDILLEQTDDILRIVVRDDGHGGADASRGSGLRGLARRLGIFDGKVAISSPAGGPTELTMEIPCVSSSPRTSTSSGRV